MALKEDQQPEVVEEVEKEEEVEVKEKTHVHDDDDVDDETLHSIPTTSPPYIVFGRDERKQIFYSLRDRTCSTCIVPEIQGMNCDACCNGWLVMCNYDSTQCFLLNPVSMEKIELPPMTMEIEIKLYTRRCVLASPPPNYLVVFFSRTDFFYSFCRPGDKKWIKQELQEDTGEDWGWMIESVVSCNGKIYMSYARGGWIGILDINAMMMCNNSQELPPPRKLVKMLPDEEGSDDDDDDDGGDHRENIIYTSNESYLVESCGDVFMVILNYWKHSTNVHSLDTYRLKMTMETSKAEQEITSMEWEMMDNLGNDRMFMLGYTSSFSICASKIGATKNKILFQRYNFPDNKLIVCDLEEYGYLSIEQPCPDEEEEDEDDDKENDDEENEELRLDDDEWIQMKIREEFVNSPYWMFLD